MTWTTLGVFVAVLAGQSFWIARVLAGFSRIVLRGLMVSSRPPSRGECRKRESVWPLAELTKLKPMSRDM